MTFRFTNPTMLRGFVVGATLTMLVATTAEAAKRSRRNRPVPVKSLSVDPKAEVVELFQGIEEKKFDVTLIPKDSQGGNVLIENKSDKPLTVQFPQAFVGVQVLHQFGGGGFGGQGGGLGGGLGGQQGGMGGGQQQPFGGGGGGMGGGMMGGMGGGMGGMGGGGGGFFSIPPKKIARVPFTSVCLAHGKKEPHPKGNYRMVPVEEFTKDETLQELIRMVGTGRLHKPSAQAAAWHLTDEMSWRELASKKVRRLGGLGAVPYFAPQHLFRAQGIVALAQGRAREAAKGKDATPARKTPTRTPARIR